MQTHKLPPLTSIAPAVLLALAAACLVPAHAATFNEGWRFHLGDLPGAESADFNDRGWRVVDLPHDWTIEQPRDPHVEDGASVAYFPGGTGWYRKEFVVPAAEAGRAVDVIFDGVQQDSEVWINGHDLGLQPHGYIGFVHTLTPWLRPPGERTVIAVRAINPGNNSRWYPGSGIYREVQLRYREPVDVATWGLQFDTLELHDGRARIQLRTQLRNDTDAPARVSLLLHLRSPAGATHDVDLGSMALAAHSTERASQSFVVDAAELWSPDSPQLYTAELELQRDGRRAGGTTELFGVRHISVSATKGFLLNGQPLKLRGGCLHHDNGLIGAAAFPAAEWRRVAVMKRNGFNAIRTSHNPPSTAFLDACDQLGVMVIDEFTDCWELPKRPNGYSRYFDEHWDKDLRAMLHRDYNHPSVVMWSIGNEIPERALPSGIGIGTRLAATVHAVDPFRPVTNAFCSFWDNPSLAADWEVTAPGLAVLDVAGYNYLSMRFKEDHARHPERVFVSTESFPLRMFEDWRTVEKNPFVIGDFVWTGMDYLGESGIGRSEYTDPKAPEISFLGAWPYYVSGCGDIDIIGNKNPQSWFRDVIWNRSPVELLVHAPVPDGKKESVTQWGWPDERPTWTWPGAEGKTLAVRVVSRAPRVRLELNGRIIGEKSIDATAGVVATFDVPYAPGELKATAMSADGAVLGRRTLVSAGAPAAIAATPEFEHVRAARSQLIYVPIELHDAAGRLADATDAPLSAETRGPVELLAFGSADPATPDSSTDRDTRTYRGRALLVLRSTGAPGSVHVTLRSPNLPASETDFTVR